MVIIFGFAASYFDLKERRVPNKLILMMLGTWAFAMSVRLLIDFESAIQVMSDGAIGATVSGGLFMVVYLLSRKGLGGGDVKFMAAAGLFLGFGASIMTILIGSVFAAVTGIILILLKRIGRKDPITLVPFLQAGIIAAYILSNR